MCKFRQVATTMMILLLCLFLVGCGGKSGSDEPQTEVDEQQVEAPDETATEGDETTKDGGEVEADVDAGVVTSGQMKVACLEGSCEDEVALVERDYGCRYCKSVDGLARSIIDAEVDLAIVPPDVSAALYNATGGSIMAIDAVTDENGAPSAVCVIRIPYFTTDPESVVSFVAEHQKTVDHMVGEGRFLRGSAMQRELSASIADAYVEDASSVGGALPPDNFYFLG